VVEFSRSSDVYSFGILLLEIACGEQGGMLIREKVWQLYINRSLLWAADDRLKGEFDRSEMESVLILGLWCSYLDNNKRPSMEQVMAVLEHGKQLPYLNSLDTTSFSAQLETYIDPQAQAPTSAASSSYEQMHE
jgi:serine/threonine protein kinase